MSYTALYRKFRPNQFEDVKGQEHIVTTLKNQILLNRIGHAYLFCGTRGTGKTTVAKIMAKAVNCEAPKDGSPCNECSMCQSINKQSDLNVIEIDAASNNGVDNIRDIIDEVQYSPTKGKYKVYIIDEVHMLSSGAFNALLKTLEEPPSYVIFILATTEVHKIPVTILSRCQRYDFKRITVGTIEDRLKELMCQEEIEVEDRAIRYIAKMADGAMRDALSLLDQCISFYFGKTLTYDNVLEVLGSVDNEVFSELFRYIANNSVIDSIKLLERLTIEGKELGQFIIDFIWYLRNLLLIKTSKENLELIDISTEQLKLFQEDATRISIDTLLRHIRIFSELSNQIKYASQKRVFIEIAIIKLCTPSMEQNYDSILERMSQLEKKIELGEFTISTSKTEEKAEKKVTTPKKPAILPKAVSEDLKLVASNWNKIISSVSAPMKAMLMSAIPSVGKNNELQLLFHEAVDRDFIQKEEHRSELEKIIQDKIKKTVVVDTKLLEDESEILTDNLDLTKIIKMDIEYED